MIAVDNFGVVGKKSEIDNVSLQQIINRIPLLKYRYLGSLPSACVPSFDKDTFVIVKTQPSKLQGEHWIIDADSPHRMYFADFFDREKYSIPKQHYKKTMPVSLQSLFSVCDFSLIYAASQFFKFRQEEITEVNLVFVLLIRNNGK